MFTLLLFDLHQCGSPINIIQNKIIKTEKNMNSINAYFERKYDPKTGLEMYNFEAAKKSETNPAVIKAYSGETILMYQMAIGGGYYDEYFSDFRRVQKQFYPNGTLKQTSYFYQKNLKVGIWKYYDERGNLIKEVDEDEKFKKSKIKINDILRIAEKEGLINLKTGEGGTDAIIENDQVITTEAKINIMYSENNNNEEPIWYIITQDYTLSIVYKINGITGKMERTEKQTYSIE
jgi:hypothetical protein